MEKCLAAFEAGFGAADEQGAAALLRFAQAAPRPTVCFPNDSIDSMSICCLLHHKLQLPPRKCDLRTRV